LQQNVNLTSLPVVFTQSADVYNPFGNDAAAISKVQEFIPPTPISVPVTGPRGTEPVKMFADCAEFKPLTPAA
jgi:hypothetical protein